MTDLHDRIEQLLSDIAALKAELARVRDDEARECAALCRSVWKDAPNTRSQYMQNALSHGCLESATAIERRIAERGNG